MPVWLPTFNFSPVVCWNSVVPINHKEHYFPVMIAWSDDSEWSDDCKSYVFSLLSVEEVAGLPSVSLKALEGMEGLDLSASSIRPRDSAALAAMMKLCQGWQKPGATVKGRCTLISRSRLEVDITYHADVIGAFKQMPSKNYGELCLRLDCWTIVYTCQFLDSENIRNKLFNINPPINSLTLFFFFLLKTWKQGNGVSYLRTMESCVGIWFI